MNNREAIEKKVDEIFNILNINSFPVPLIDVASYLRYGIYYFEVNANTRDISGAVDYENKKILVNPNDKRKRQNFTIGHEIGHIVLEHRQDNENIKYDYRKSIYNTSDKKEQEANRFSAMLLMPEKEFKYQWDKLDSVEYVSDYFKTSQLAVCFRAKDLKLVTDLF